MFYVSLTQLLTIQLANASHSLYVDLPDLWIFRLLWSQSPHVCSPHTSRLSRPSLKKLRSEIAEVTDKGCLLSVLGRIT